MKSRHIAVALCAFVMAMSFGMVVLTQSVSGTADDEQQSWVDVVPQIQKRKELAADEYSKEQTNFPQCEEKTSYEWVASPLWSATPPINAIRDSCMYAMSSGYFDQYSHSIIPFGSDRLQRLMMGDFTSHPESVPMYAIPGTNKIALIFDSTYPFSNGGAKLRIIDDWSKSFPPTLSTDGLKNVVRKLSAGFDYELKDQTGNYVQVAQNGLSYSSNGNWLQITATNKAKLLLNLDTHEVLPFADYQAVTFSAFSAVSNDGRYVASTKDLNSFKIYDTQRCAAPAGEFVSRNCQSIELFDVLKNALGGSGDIRIGGMKFIGVGDALDVNVAKTEDGQNWSYATYRLSSPSHAPNKYLALGDSYSAGEGSYNYRPETNFYNSDSEFNICHQSLSSYPYLVGGLLKDLDIHSSVACSGSESKDIFSLNDNPMLYDDSKLPIEHHSSALGINQRSDSVVRELLTGYTPQAAYLSPYQASIVTIGVGGNGIGFAQKVEKCVAGTEDCFNSAEERQQQTNEIDQWVNRWGDQLAKLKAMQPANGELYAVGYPRVMNPSGVCGVNVQVNQFEREMGNRFIDYLNESLNVAADRAGVKFISVADAFVWGESDFRLCGNQSEHAMNGLILGSSRQACGSAVKPGEMRCSETYHPTAYGQMMIASKVYTALRDDTADMPAPDNSKSKADEYFRDRFIDGTPNAVSGNYYNYNNLVGSAMRTRDFFKEVGQRFTTSAATVVRQTAGMVQENAPFDIELHSTPIKVGSAVINSEGDVDGSFVIPASVEGGYHELHLKIPLVDGTIYDSYEIVYVAARADDMDGDGIKDVDDTCRIVKNSGIDEDHDGVDDVCDGYIAGQEVSRDEAIRHLVEVGVFTQAEAERILANNPTIGQEHIQSSAPEESAAIVPVSRAATNHGGMANDRSSTSSLSIYFTLSMVIAALAVTAAAGAVLWLKLSKRPR